MILKGGSAHNVFLNVFFTALVCTCTRPATHARKTIKNRGSMEPKEPPWIYHWKWMETKSPIIITSAIIYQVGKVWGRCTLTVLTVRCERNQDNPFLHAVVPVWWLVYTVVSHCHRMPSTCHTFHTPIHSELQSEQDNALDIIRHLGLTALALHTS